MSKAFDAVEFMRERRAQIDDEDRGLTWEEKARKTLALLRGNPLWKHLESRVVGPGRAFAANRHPSAHTRKRRRAR